MPQEINFQHQLILQVRMNLTENEVSMILQRLMQRGFLQIDQSEDRKGVLHESFLITSTVEPTY